MAFDPYKTIENVAAAEFTDGGDNKPFKDLEIALDYAADGRTEVVISDIGESLLSGVSFTDNALIGADGTVASTAGFHYTAPIPVSGIRSIFVGFKYTGTSTTYNLRVHSYSGTETTDWIEQLKEIPLVRNTFVSEFVTIPATCKYIRLSVAKTGTDLTCKKGWSSTISLGETPIYGGTLDVTSGKLTSTLDADGDPLETPVVTMIAGTELVSLLRANSVTADSGNIIKLIYMIEYYIRKGENFDLKSGYYMINGSGLDLTGGLTPQVIAGLHADCATAMSIGKLVLLENCVAGTGVPVSPLPVIVKASSTSFVMIWSTLTITVTNEDSVTIVDSSAS